MGETVDVSRYTFGDDRSALARLRLVAGAYESVSRTFLAAHRPRRVQVALDLGCGPGFSTELLDDVCRPTTLVVIDASPTFVDSARDRLPGVRFETHDVTVDPLPGGPADVIYSRLLLAHVPDPVLTAQGWRGQLRPDGTLLIEDLEDVVSPPGALRDYEDVSATIVRSGGGLMYAGAVLAGLGGRTERVTVPSAVAARIYLFNVRRWRSDPALPVSHDRLRTLEAELLAIADDGGGAEVSWIVRQLALG